MFLLSCTVIMVQNFGFSVDFVYSVSYLKVNLVLENEVKVEVYLVVVVINYYLVNFRVDKAIVDYLF